MRFEDRVNKEQETVEMNAVFTDIEHAFAGWLLGGMCMNITVCFTSQHGARNVNFFFTFM